MKITAIQSALRILYPARCLICGDIVESDFGLCAPCWGDMPFLDGLACDCCGAPLIGVSFDWAETCDDCLAQPRPWAKGRAALLYQGSARKLVLGLKHGDRTDVVRPAAQWLLSSCEDILTEDSLFVAVPLHWRRQLKRRYNQSSLLAYEMAKLGHYGFWMVRSGGSFPQNHLKTLQQKNAPLFCLAQLRSLVECRTNFPVALLLSLMM